MPSVIYHAQQCAEKYLKALLIELGANPPKIHDLVRLSRLLTPLCAEWDWPIDELRLLSQSAVISRYPGDVAELLEAEAAHEICTNVRQRLRELLRLGD